MALAKNKGKCTNFGHCDVADSHAAVDSADPLKLVCPKCERPLSPVEASGLRIKPLALVGVLVLAALGTGVYYWFGGPDGSPAAPSRASAGKEGVVRCRINIWVGCAGGLAANGGLDTQKGSIFDGEGIQVSFKVIDDWTEGATALATGNVDVMLTTVDVWAKDYAQLAERGFKGRAFLMVDWSRGADGVIGKPGLRSIEDLAGKSIAFAPSTPSHFLIWNGVRNSGLSREQRDKLMTYAVHTKDGIEPATLFAQGKIDAAVAWDPDMSDAVAKRPGGGRKIYDTTVANKLIADILVVSDAYLEAHPETVKKFAGGWLKGVEFLRSEPARAYNIIGSIKDFNIPTELAKTMLQGVELSDFTENESFFGTAGELFDYANIFRMAQEMYRDLRAIKRHTPDIEATMTREVVHSMRHRFPPRSTASAAYGPLAPGQVPISTQEKTIFFEPGSAEVSMDSRGVVDDIAAFMKAYENTVVEIAGNTDSTGDARQNVVLSLRRAEAVKRYLSAKYGFPATRMIAKGNGPAQPKGDNATDEGRARNRRTDIRAYENRAGSSRR